MHQSVLDFAAQVLTAELATDKMVLEVGSGIVNGSVRPLIEAFGPSAYVGVDSTEGPGVDLVADCERLSEHIEPFTWDLVLSTEMLEHVRDWRACIIELAKALAPGGTLLLTTRSPGFKYHPHPEDHWRYTLADMAAILSVLDLETITLEDDPGAFGVLVLARRPADWNPSFLALEAIKPYEVGPQPETPLLVEGTGRGGEKLCVAFPLYRQVPVDWLFNWLQMIKDPLVGHVATEGMYLPQAMETLVAMAFEHVPAFERLVVFEHDMIPPLDAFNRIAQYKPEHDIVGSIYFKHQHPYHVMAWMQIDKPRFSPLTRDVVRTMVESPALYQVDGVAMGFTSIHRRVFENWNPDVPMWTPTPPMVGHDLHFCNEAKKPQHGPDKDQGFKIWVDSGIGCGHLTLVPIGYPHFLEALSEDEPETWAELWDRRDEVRAKAVIM